MLRPGAHWLCVWEKLQKCKAGHHLICILSETDASLHKRSLTKTFIKCYWIVSSGVKMCDPGGLKVASLSLSVVLFFLFPLSFFFCVWMIWWHHSSSASNWMQRVRSSAVAQGSEYFSIYLQGLEGRCEGRGETLEHQQKKKSKLIE